MERRAKVELFEQIRREYEFGVGTIRGVAHKLRVHRRMVPQALASAEPPERKKVARERPVIGPLRLYIDAILEADRNAPRKQRHTVHRIYERIRTELPDYQVAEVTVRSYVRKRKRALGWSTRATCVPQTYAPGQEGQVDWYEACAELNGARVKLQMFSLRSMMSGAAFHRAYHRATQQAFLEAHEHAFHFYGGVFRLLRYDNLKSAVKKILRGQQREQATRFIAFRSHWRFESDFCTPAEPHEKGGMAMPDCQNHSTQNTFKVAGPRPLWRLRTRSCNISAGERPFDPSHASTSHVRTLCSTSGCLITTLMLV